MRISGRAHAATVEDQRAARRVGVAPLAFAGVPGGARAHAHEGFGEDAISDYPLGFRRKLSGAALN